MFLSIVKLVFISYLSSYFKFYFVLLAKASVYRFILNVKCNCNLAAPTVRGIYVVREWLLLFSYYCVVVLTVASFGYSTVVYYLTDDSQNNISIYISGLLAVIYSVCDCFDWVGKLVCESCVTFELLNVYFNIISYFRIFAHH